MKVFISYSRKNAPVVEAISDAIRNAGHTVVIPMDMFPGSDVYTAVQTSLRSADVVVAVVGRDDSSWVSYELGMATGIGLPLLILSTSDDRIPAPLMNMSCIRLTGNDAYEIPRILRAINELKPAGRNVKRKFKSAEAALKAAAADPSMLAAMSSHEFEKLIADLFTERGYIVKSESGRDMGVDFSIESPDGVATCAVEVKKLGVNSKISVDSVRRLSGSLELMGAGIGLLISTVAFTASALALAKNYRVRLRTLEDVLSAKTAKDLLADKESKAS